MELSKGGAVQKRYIRGNDLVYADKGENTEENVLCHRYARQCSAAFG